MAAPFLNCLIIFTRRFKKLETKQKILALEFLKLVERIVEAMRKGQNQI
jgi:hypothetical protein